MGHTATFVWHLLPHIGQYAARLGVAEPSPAERLALALLLSDQFEQFALFRPEFIDGWSRGQSIANKNWIDQDRESEDWQRGVVDPGGRGSEFHGPFPCPPVPESGAAFKGCCIQGEAWKVAFPKLFVLGTGSLDPLLVRVLGLVADAGCDVEAHVVLPSLSYLGDFRKAPPPCEQDPETIEMLAGPPLLVSMGKHAIGSFLLLGQLDENYANWPENNVETGSPAPTLLRRLQADIRSLDLPGRAIEMKADDASVRVHSCFGPRREMEGVAR